MSCPFTVLETPGENISRSHGNAVAAFSDTNVRAPRIYMPPSCRSPLDGAADTRVLHVSTSNGLMAFGLMISTVVTGILNGLCGGGTIRALSA